MTRAPTEPIKCPLCNFTSKQLPKFESHVAEMHSLTLRELWTRINGERPKCACGCGGETNWIGWKRGYNKVIIGHNGNLVAVHGIEGAREISQKRKAKLIGKTGWSKGLTKETDERIKKRGEATSISRKAAFANGTLTAWNIGLTKETDSRVAKGAETLHQAHVTGATTAWCKGLNESTDERLRIKNNALREAYASGRLVQWHKGKTAEDDPRIAKFWKNRDAMSEYADQRFSIEEITQNLDTNTELKLIKVNSYKNIYKSSLHMKCIHCGFEEDITYAFAKIDRCPICSPVGSMIQAQLTTWIESLGFDVGKNIRGIIEGRQELDIFVPAKSFAIEVNGIYWHSELFNKKSTYHQKKSDACKRSGIDLMHIFEDEFHDKPDIVKSMISFRLGITNTRVHARECDVIALSNTERHEFFERNHLDGDTQATHAFGLIADGKIIYAISLRRPFHDTYEDALEIARCCPAVYHSIPGGLSKLISIAKIHAIKSNAKRIISYVDTRFGGDGNGYALAGFTLVKSTPPRFWWTDGHRRFNRFKYKARLNEGKSEAQVAEEAGVVKIWGCKNLVYELPLVSTPSS